MTVWETIRLSLSDDQAKEFDRLINSIWLSVESAQQIAEQDDLSEELMLELREAAELIDEIPVMERKNGL
jgi:hypothetical protein